MIIHFTFVSGVFCFIHGLWWMCYDIVLPVVLVAMSVLWI